MHLFRSNRMERLADRLARLLARPRRDLMAPEVIVVPSDGMGQWVHVALAERLGIAAHLDLRRPRAFVESLFRAALGDPTLRLDTWTRDALVWEVLALLPDAERDPRLAPLRPAVVGADAEQRYLLARRIADAFDQYAVYRPQLVLDWEAGAEPDDWQACLWRALVARAGGSHTARLFARTLDALQRRGPAAPLPERVAVLGLAAIPPLYLDTLCAIAPWTEVHLLQLAPSAEYWALVRSRREQARRGPLPGSEAEARELEGHPLLAGFGRVGRDLQDLLAERSEHLESEEDDFEAPPSDTLLRRVQADLLALRSRAPDEPKAPIAADDASVLVLGAHAPVREVEILRDTLWDLLHRLPDLSPRDIVVMTPDLSVHGPLVEAVFGVDQDDPLYLPLSVADRPVLDGHGCGRALLAVLTLATSRCSASELLDLLDHAPLRRAAGLTATDLPMVARLADAAGVRWGRDAAHRASFDQPADPVGTWRAGLDRLAMGALVDGVAPCLEVVPVEDVVGELADLAGRLVTFATGVLDACDALSRPDTVAGHAARVRALAEGWFGADPESAGELRPIREHLLRLEAVALPDPTSPGIVRRTLEAALGEERRSGSFLRGGVTVCEMTPMRAVPFRVVCMLGMSDGLFPRSDAPSGFDRISAHPHRGDRSRRDDDRYMFLEALLSARDAVVLTAVTRSVRDDRPAPPSVALTELLEALADVACASDGGDLRAQIVVQHPLQPFSWRYVDPAPPAPPAPALSTWDPAAAHAAARRGAVPPPRVAARAVPAAMPAELRLADLERFVHDPVASFVTWRLAARAPDSHRALDERPPIVPDALESWSLGERWLELARAGLDEAAIGLVLRAESLVATGAIGEVALQRTGHTARALLDAAAPRQSGARRPIVFDEEVRGVRIVGRLIDVFDAGQVGVTWRQSDRGKPRATWWIRHLALQAAGEPRRTWLISRDKAGHAQVLVFRAMPSGEAREHLEALVGLVEEGRQRPLRADADLAKTWWEAWSSRSGAEHERAGAADQAANNKLHDRHAADRHRRWEEVFGDVRLGERVEGAPPPDVERVARAVFEPMQIDDDG